MGCNARLMGLAVGERVCGVGGLEFRLHRRVSVVAGGSKPSERTAGLASGRLAFKAGSLLFWVQGSVRPLLYSKGHRPRHLKPWLARCCRLAVPVPSTVAVA